MGSTRNQRIRTSLGNLKTLESFKVPVFRIYFGSMAGNWFGMSMAMLTRSLLIYRLTDSALIIGYMALAMAIPALLVSLLGGTIADRIPKKYILIASNAGLTLIALGTALALSSGYLSKEHAGSWVILIAFAGLEGIINGFLRPSNMSIIPEIVGEQQVMNAISLSMTGRTLFRLGSPVLAGWIIDTAGFSSVYFLMAAMYITAAVTTFFLPVTGTRVHSGKSALGDMVDAFKYLRREGIIFVVVIFTICHIVSGQSFNQLLPVFTDSILHVSATDLGLLMTVSTVGALFSSLALASLPNRKRGLLLLSSGIIMGTALVIFSFSRIWFLAIGLMPFVALSQTMHGTLTATIIQTNAQPQYRGRMQSFITMSSGFSSMGTFMAGALSGAIGIQWSVASLAIFLISATLLITTVYPKLRKLE